MQVKMSWWIVLTRMGSRPVVGSSNSMISGSVASARASAARLEHAARQLGRKFGIHARQADLGQALMHFVADGCF